MTNRFLHPTYLGAGLLLLLWGCHSKSTERAKHPNFLFLFADDQRYNTINHLGNSEVSTPNLDKLAESGITFVRAHIMGGSSGAVCMPSRAMLMTSRPLSMLERQGATIPDDQLTFPEYLRHNGYITFGTGKWHNGKRAFARSFSDGGKIFFGGMSNHLAVPVFDFDPDSIYPNEKKYTGEKFSSILFADEAIRFISNYQSDSPFLAYVAFTAPHDPRMAPKDYANLYTRDNVSVPGNFLPEHPFDNGELRIRDELLAPFPRTPEIVVDQLGAYYAMITHLDNQIGRIIQALKDQNLMDKTYIIFSADNGLALGSHGLMGKQNVYDHSIRVPLIISGFDIKKDARASTICYLNDLFPTICELANLPIPAGVMSKSLLPAILDPSVQVHDYALGAYKNYQRSIRTKGNWKLIRYRVGDLDTIQLFNLNEDPLEMNNLAAQSEYQKSVTDLTNLMGNALTYFRDTTFIR